MRHLFSILFLVFLINTIHAQSVVYTVLEVSKGITFQEGKDSEPHQIKRNSELYLSNLVNIKKGQSIVIENSSSGQYYDYKSSSDQQLSVASIIHSHSKGVLESILSQLFTSDKDFSIVQSSRGGINRGNEVFSLAERISNDIIQYKYSHILLKDNNLILIKHKRQGKLFFPEIANNTSDTLYVNVLCINKDRTGIDVSFSFSKNGDDLLIVLPPQSNIVLSSYFLVDKKEREYIVFGSSHSFSSSYLRRELLSGVHSSFGEPRASIVYGVTR